MSEMRLVVVGAAGRMGRMLIKTVAETEGCRLVGAIEREGSHALGQDAGVLAGLTPLGVSVTADPLPVFGVWLRTAGGCTGQYQPTDALRVAQREVERDAAAHRRADHRGALDADGIEHGSQLVDAAPRLGGHRRAAGGGPNVADNQIGAGEQKGDRQRERPLGSLSPSARGLG